MIHQLFQDLPDDNFKIKLLNCYGIKDLNDKKEFTKNDLEDLEIIQKKRYIII
jgi:hypothetical protein